MTFKSTLLTALVFLTAVAFATGPTIHPLVSPTAICQGDSVTVAILTSDTFVTGNVFYVQLSDSAGSFAHPVVLDSVIGQGNDTIGFMVDSVSKNSSHYKIRVVSSNNTIGLDSTALTIHKTPVVTFQIPQPFYCTYAYTVPLTGASPQGGVYSGTYVSGSVFQAYVSGTGTFPVYYTYTDSIGCFTEDTSAITITASCPAPSVSVQVSPAAICAGSNINIVIQTSDVISSNNIFTVQLSDSTGSFANPTVLATDTSASGNTITIAAPAEPAGNNYKVRVVASAPSTISVPFNVSFKTTLAPPAISLNANGLLSLCTKDTFKLSIDSLHGISYRWSFNGNPITVSKYTYTAKDSGLYVVSFTDTTVAGCSSGADTVFIGIYPYPAKPVISPTGTVKVCGNGTVALSTPSINGLTYQWTNHGQNITGQTQNTYTASVTGVYLVEAVSAHNCVKKSDSVHVNIHAIPIVSFTLPFDSFCVHSAPISLSGGKPDSAGVGVYSGNFVISNSTFDPAASGVGTFKVYYTFTDTIGCSGTDSANVKVHDCTTSGLNEPGNSHVFEMFPNPANGKVNISVSAANCRMRVFNLLGQEISSQVFTQQLTYSVEKLPAGVYLVEISDAANSWKTTQRLVVQ